MPCYPRSHRGRYSQGLVDAHKIFQRSTAALELALALDPDLVIAASQLIVNRMDRGELVKAYDEATALVKRRPESPRPTSLSAMFCAMPACWRSPRDNAILPSP